MRRRFHSDVDVDVAGLSRAVVLLYHVLFLGESLLFRRVAGPVLWLFERCTFVFRGRLC